MANTVVKGSNMIKRPTLNGRKRTSELTSGPAVVTQSKKAKLAELQAEGQSAAKMLDTVAEKEKIVVKALVKAPEAPLTPKSAYSKACPTKPEEMLAYLEAYAKQLEKAFASKDPADLSKEQKEMLRQEIGLLVNHRAQQLEKKGISGKAKRMQCEALLYTLTEGLKKQGNIDLSNMRLVKLS